MSLTSLPSANEVCEGCVFTPVCHYVHGGGWGCLGPGPGRRVCLGVSRSRPGVVQGQAQGCVYPGGCPGPGPGPGGCPGPGCVSQHALRQTPHSRWLLLQTVRILLECSLVLNCFRTYPCLFLSCLLSFLIGLSYLLDCSLKSIIRIWYTF